MILLLKEITRRLSNNQLDHILIKKDLESFCYATSYFNFVSDHNSIVIRIGDKQNQPTQEAKERINFSAELHLRKNPNYEDRYETSDSAPLHTESTSKSKNNNLNKDYKDNEHSHKFK